MADEDESSAPVTAGGAQNTVPPSSMADANTASGKAEEMMKELETDPYEEDEAELRFLLSKPTCFIMLGKPGAGKTTLAHRLAQEWKCEMVNATDVISQAMEMQTELGLKAQEILLRGEAIPEDMAARMIEEKINSPEVAHHGYVLDGFPSISEDYMTISDQLELVQNWKLKPDFIVNIKVPDPDLEERRVGLRVDPMTGDIYTKEMYDPDKPTQPANDSGNGEDEEEEEEEEEEALPEEGSESNVSLEAKPSKAAKKEEGGVEVPAEIIERLVRRPEDLSSHVTENIKKYKSNMLRILEDYMADHDQQYLIELDGNKPVTFLFKELMSRLNCFVLRPAAVPIRLQDVEEEELPEDMETDELMRQLSGREMIAPRYRWRRSRWLRYCPVALAEGNLAQGKPEFAVSFLDKTYVLSSGEAMSKFMKNPRPYLLPPQPRPPCKLVVTGPPCSGKSTLSRHLAQKYGATILDIDELIKQRIEEERQKQADTAREEALEGAIATVKQRLRDQQDADLPKTEVPSNPGDTTAPETTDGDKEEPDETDGSDGTAAASSSSQEVGKEGVSSEAVTAEAVVTGEGSSNGEELNSETGLPLTLAGLPEEDENTAEAVGSEKPEAADTISTATRSEAPAIEVTADHPEVKAMCDAAAEAAKEQAVTLPPEAYIEVVEQAILNCEKDMRDNSPGGPLNGGWILDDFPRTREQWSALIEKGGPLPDDVICLRDESENGDFLIKRWYHCNREEIDSKANARKEAAAETKRLQEEAEAARRQKEEQEKKLAAEAARKAEEERRLAEGEGAEGEIVAEPMEFAGEPDTVIDSLSVTVADTIPETIPEVESDQMLQIPTIEEESLDDLDDNDMDDPGSSEHPLNDQDSGNQSLPQIHVLDSLAEEAAEDDDDDDDDSGVDEDEDSDSDEDEEDDDEEEGGAVEEGEGEKEVAKTPVPDEAPATQPNSPEVSQDETAKAPTPPPATPDEDKMPPEGPELDAQRELRKVFDTEWPGSLGLLTGSTQVEPGLIDVCSKSDEGVTTARTEDQLLQDSSTHLEKSLQYVAWEVTGTDLDEEAEDAEADNGGEEGDEAEEGEEEEDPNRGLRKALGDVNYFCPVALKEKHVLWPGDPEKSVKYREKTYYLSTQDNKDKFLAEPQKYLPTDKPCTPPPVRLVMMGPKGSGKTMHGRDLARKLGLFHIQWTERLQELVIGKTKHLVGPEYEEERKEEEEADQEDAGELEEGAILGPDGQPVPPSSDGQPTLQKEATQATGSSGEEKKEEEEEEEEIKLTDDEEAIKNYLESDDPLPTELLDKIVMEWWHKEPFKSTGFVLEGFPRTADEAEYLGTQGLFPDMGVILAVEDSDVIGRLLPPKLERWRARRARVLAKRQKRKELKQKKREAEIAKRRAELEKEMAEKKAEKRALREAEQGSEDEYNSEEEEDGEEEEDIDALIAEEFEEEEEEEEEELEPEEDAVDRMRNKLEEVYDNDTNRLAVVQEKLEDLLIPRIELDGGRKPHIVRYMMNKRLKKITHYRHSIFERVYPIPEKLAVRMLQVGYKQPSRFGKWDPVDLVEGDCIQPMQGAGFPTFSALYRQHIYYFSSVQNRETFMQDPMTYLSQPTPKPVVPIRMAILGPPKSGKTTLAKRFAEEYGLLRLSMGEAIRTILELQPKSNLARNITEHLYKGLPVPDDLAVQALEIALMDMRCQTRGYILDGYPVTKQQVELMTERSIIPVRVVELQVNSRELVTRATKDRYAAERSQPLHDSAQILAIKLGAWKKEIAAVRDWYGNENSNLVEVDGERSKWWVWNRALEIGKQSVVQIQAYLQRISEGKAASIANMCITPNEFVVRLGDYGQYCPVSLAERGELVNCATTKSLDYAAEFRGHYYKMAGPKELKMFLEHPEIYVPPLAVRKLPPPELLPIRRTSAEAKAMFPKPIELQGYCSVTYLDGKCRYEAIIAGDPELVVEYQERLYYFQSEEHLAKFMSLPEKYWNLKLPHKLPPKKAPLLVGSLPMLGYMEQSASLAITKALTAVGNLKPKYPFLSATQSSLIYVAYHLKAYNPKSSEFVRKRFKKKLADFEETCQLIRYLGNNMTKRYKKPEDRPIDFDFKLQAFMGLKSSEQMNTLVS